MSVLVVVVVVISMAIVSKRRTGIEHSVYEVLYRLRSRSNLGPVSHFDGEFDEAQAGVDVCTLRRSITVRRWLGDMARIPFREMGLPKAKQKGDGGETLRFRQHGSA